MPKFEELNLSASSEVKEIEFNGIKIEVKQYLPVETKAGIVSLSVRGALVNGTVDEVLSSAYFHMFLVENYTNISFDEGEVSDILENFDKIFTSGLLDAIIDAIPREEYNYLSDSVNLFKDQVAAYSGSFASAFSNSSDFAQLMATSSAPKPSARSRKKTN
jgi:hypothetical protein